MELSYVFNAAKRYWWVVVACALVGGLAGFVSAKPPNTLSRATFSVISPGASSGDAADRLVATQVSVLGSDEFLAEVAKKLGSGYSERELRSAVTIAQRSGTSIVDIVAMTDDGARSKDIVTKYIDVAQGREKQAAAEQSASAARKYDQKLAEMRNELALVDASISSALAGYLVPGNPQIPTVEQVRPDLASKKTLLLAQYDELNTEKSERSRARPRTRCRSSNAARIRSPSSIVRS